MVFLIPAGPYRVMYVRMPCLYNNLSVTFCYYDIIAAMLDTQGAVQFRKS